MSIFLFSAIPFAFFSCTGAENNICCTNPGAFPPAPKTNSGTVLPGVLPIPVGRGSRAVGDDDDLGVADVSVR